MADSLGFTLADYEHLAPDAIQDALADSRLDFIDMDHATPESIMDAMIHVNERLAHYKRWKDQLVAALILQHKDGKVDDTVDFDGYRFAYSSGKTSYDYPVHITELEAQLEEAKEAAVATGRAVIKKGKPFWTVRHIKP